MNVIVGVDYLLTSNLQPNCRGHRYRIEFIARMDHTGQRLVVVTGVTGPETGKHVAHTWSSFRTRYVPWQPEEAQENVAGANPVGTGW